MAHEGKTGSNPRETKIIQQKEGDEISEVKRDNFTNVQHFLESKLRRSDISRVESELRKRFPLSKVRQVFKKRMRRKGCARNPGLSNTQRKSLGLFDLDRNGLLYENLLPLHQMWKDYMDNYLGLKILKGKNSFGDILSANYEETMQQLYKADYHGAYIKVSKSLCATLVGIEGIIVFETRNMLKLLGKDNILRSIPKISCQFELKLGDYEVSFLGKNFMIKPAERSIKKLKAIKAISL